MNSIVKSPEIYPSCPTCPYVQHLKKRLEAIIENNNGLEAKIDCLYPGNMLEIVNRTHMRLSYELLKPVNGGSTNKYHLLRRQSVENVLCLGKLSQKSPERTEEIRSFLESVGNNGHL